MNVIDTLLLSLFTCAFGCLITVVISVNDFDKRLNNVGIARIVECHIDTTDVHSNWYEIVWMDGYDDPRSKK